MSADRDISVLADVWVQVFTLLLIVSAVFSLHYLLAVPPAAPAAADGTGHRSGDAPAAAAERTSPAPVQAEARPAPQAAPQPAPPAAAPSATPAAAPAAASPADRVQWVISKESEKHTTLGSVIAMARDGDTILVQPGRYDVSALIGKSLTITGGGASPAEVELTHAFSPTLSVNGGDLTLRNLTIGNTATLEHWTLSISRGKLNMRGVRLKSSVKGLKAVDSSVEASDCEFDAETAVFVSGRSNARFSDVSLTGSYIGLRVEDGTAEVLLEDSIVSKGGTGIVAAGGARVEIKGTTVSGHTAYALAAGSGAEIRVKDSSLTENADCAAFIHDTDGRVVLEKVLLRRNKCGVQFAGKGSLDVRLSRFRDNSMGAVALSPLQGDLAVITGHGNEGFTVPGEKKPAARKRAAAAPRGK